MKILIACEHTGVVRDAFRARGHDAVSCDLLPSETDGPHIVGDVLNYLYEDWDMMIAHPPCTYLSSSGLHWNNKIPGRAEKTLEAVQFANTLMNAPIYKIVIENPIGRLGTAIRKADQIIQPFQFGHPESKSTCLWLEHLPLLVPTEILEMPECGYWDNQTPSRQNKLGPSKDRWKLRSATYQGIADAMANQWG
ncbi:MAG: DNA cytosine methyltransferase [Tenericutes bacterium]|nr:MAG: DNA cytosine methyltransferase [Mycoplasmatota bacterium]